MLIIPQHVFNMNNEIVQFKIENIEINRISISQQPQKFNSEKYGYKLNVEHLFNIEENTVMVLVSVSVMAGKNLLSEVAINIYYNVNNLKNFDNKSEKRMEFPEDFTTAINAISISTLRGVMFSEFRGTYLHNAILPVVSPRSLEIAD